MVLDRVCIPKGMGGVGIRKLQEMNQVFVVQMALEIQGG